MSNADVKSTAFDEIDRNRKRIVELAQSIWNEPEEGFKEFKTAEKVKKTFREMDVPFEDELAITGVKGKMQSPAPGPTVAILGELDAIINADHSAADGETCIVHACGHHAQVASMIGAGYGLKSVMDRLSGNVVLFAVPAEEAINLEFRKGLRQEGKIHFFGGKQELVRIGAFDDIDIALMHHVWAGRGRREAEFTTTNAIVCKRIRFIGKASHAGGAPDKGINALHAYHVALAAVNAQRETFRDEDSVRIHGIVTKGGDSVNVVPGEVIAEMFVRAKNLDALRDANEKTDRAFRAGALGLGAEVEIETVQGYLSMLDDADLVSLWSENGEELLGKGRIYKSNRHRAAGTDMGDLSHIMPCIHPWIGGGFNGSLHGSDFTPADEESAYILPAKITAATVIDLLSDEAAAARRVLENHSPALTKKKYIELLDSFCGSEHFTS